MLGSKLRVGLSPASGPTGLARDVAPPGQKGRTWSLPTFRDPVVYTCLPSPSHPYPNWSFVPGAGAQEVLPSFPTRLSWPPLIAGGWGGLPTLPHTSLEAHLLLGSFIH